MSSVVLLPDKDTFLDSSNTTTNYGTNTAVYAHVVYVSGSKTARYRGLSAWTIPAEVTSEQVLIAQLVLWVSYTGSTPAYSIYRCQRTWTEAGATWNTYDGVNNWQTAGADGANDKAEWTTALDFTAPASTGWFAVTCTTQVKEAITSYSGLFSILVHLDNESPGSSQGMDWASRDNTGAWLYSRPMLVIVRPPLGNPIYL